MYPIYAFILFAQFLHNNLVKFCCARLNIFKLCTLKALILKGLNRYDIPISLCPLKIVFNYVLIFYAYFIRTCEVSVLIK